MIRWSKVLKYEENMIVILMRVEMVRMERDMTGLGDMTIESTGFIDGWMESVRAKEESEMTPMVSGGTIYRSGAGWGQKNHKSGFGKTELPVELCVDFLSGQLGTLDQS